MDLVAQLDNTADVPRAIDLLRKGLQSIPNQAAGKEPDVEVLEFTERGPGHADHYWDVYFDTNRMIVDGLTRCGSPVPRIPVAMHQGVASSN